VDIFSWWASKIPAFPILSIIVRRYLAILAILGAIEGNFNDSGNIITNRRSQLYDETAKYLLFIKNWSNFNKDNNIKKYDDLYDYTLYISEEEDIKDKKGKGKAIDIIDISSGDEDEEESEEEDINYSDLD
jgi:hypothetical protein